MSEHSGDERDSGPLTMAHTAKGFDYWQAHEQVSPAVRSALSLADVLVIPQEGFRDAEGLFFPTGTEQLLHWLKANAPEALTVDICADDEGYRELALHSALLIVGGFLVTSIAAPVLVHLICKHIDNKRSRDPSVDTKFSIVVEEKEGDHRKAVEISYDGPAEKAPEHLDRALRTLRAQGMHIPAARSVASLKSPPEAENRT